MTTTAYSPFGLTSGKPNSKIHWENPVIILNWHLILSLATHNELVYNTVTLKIKDTKRFKM